MFVELSILIVDRSAVEHLVDDCCVSFVVLKYAEKYVNIFLEAEDCYPRLVAKQWEQKGFSFQLGRLQQAI